MKQEFSIVISFRNGYSVDFLTQNLHFMYSDVAWFTLCGYINSHNNRHWSTENPHLAHEVPLHDLKVGVWCAVGVLRITGPVFSA
jgi:hypothetical protein